MKLSASEQKRVPSLRLAIKNAMLHYLQRNRKQQKPVTLTSILEQASVKAKKKMLEQLQLRKEMQTMGLVQQLEVLDSIRGRITESRFETLKRSS